MGSADGDSVEVTTSLGRLRGEVKQSKGVGPCTYYSFKGIPYAKPPLGPLRFKAPVPVEPWAGVRESTREGNDTLQRHMFFGNKTGDEDCLYLNVYTPRLEGGAAVMVWFHGGGFGRGSGSTELYGPEFLVERGVLLVTVNYRCGVLGFLSLGSAECPGNAGLKDQALALRWVRDHVARFGGDPGNVTIFGQSAGGASVHYHLLSPLSTGLFHRAILQSGSALCQWAHQPSAARLAALLALGLGCPCEPTSDPGRALAFLRSLPADRLLDAQEDDALCTEQDKVQRFSCMWTPCVEVAGEKPFLPASPRQLMETGRFNRVPVMMGCTDKEGLLALAHKTFDLDQINGDHSLLLPVDLAVPASAEERQTLGSEVLRFYVRDERLTWDNLHGFIDLISDTGFAVAGDWTRRALLLHSGRPVFSYLFAYTGPRSFSSFLLPRAYPDQGPAFVGSGASHGDELAHLFTQNLAQTPHRTPEGDDAAFVTKLTTSWTNFAKTGDPNCDVLGASWTADSLQGGSFLEFSSSCKSVAGAPFPERLRFWKQLYEKHGTNY